MDLCADTPHASLGKNRNTASFFPRSTPCSRYPPAASYAMLTPLSPFPMEQASNARPTRHRPRAKSAPWPGVSAMYEPLKTSWASREEGAADSETACLSLPLHLALAQGPLRLSARQPGLGIPKVRPLMVDRSPTTPSFFRQTASTQGSRPPLGASSSDGTGGSLSEHGQGKHGQKARDAGWRRQSGPFLFFVRFLDSLSFYCVPSSSPPPLFLPLPSIPSESARKSGL